MQHVDLPAPAWPDYELIDSGNNRKLERYGKFFVIRPETQALWLPAQPALWKQAHAEFRVVEGKGKWQAKGVPAEWTVAWSEAKFLIRLTSFKHTGLFPEQAANWEWLTARARALTSPRVLNLFGYTGAASTIMALSGAQVTHVDASKQSNVWARENARLSGVAETAIRYLLEDALKFAEREVRRGALYQAIILDPPAFGRGPKGEVWHIEEHLPRLMVAVQKLLDQRPGSFLLLNGYAAGYSPQSLRQLVSGFFPAEDGHYGELQLPETATGGERCVPSGIYVRLTRGTAL